MLLDVNVLIAVAWPNHVHHETARLWFREHSGGGWATCPVTESGFVRVSSNASALGEVAVSPGEAIELLRRLTAHGDHRFLADDVSLRDVRHVDRDRLVGHRQVTDAHLLELALRHGTRLVTLDRRIRSLLPSDGSSEACLIELGDQR